MTYEIKRVKNVGFSAIVYSISYENPLQDINSISHDLFSDFQASCDVLFDLLLSNGEEFNRFILGHFDGKNLNYESLKIINISDQNMLKKINSYYSGKFAYLKNSVLNSSQILKYAK